MRSGIQRARARTSAPPRRAACSPRPDQFASRSAWCTSSSLLLVAVRGLSPCIVRMCPSKLCAPENGRSCRGQPGFDTQNCCSRGSAPAVVGADRLQCRRSRTLLPPPFMHAERRTATVAARVLLSPMHAEGRAAAVTALIPPPPVRALLLRPAHRCHR